MSLQAERGLCARRQAVLRGNTVSAHCDYTSQVDQL